MGDTWRSRMPSTMIAGQSQEARPATPLPPPAAQPGKALDAWIARPAERAGNKSAVLDLAYEEFCRRTEAGETIDPAEFCQRYPQYQASLCRLLLMHHCLVEPLESEPAAALNCWPLVGQDWLGLQLIEELGRGSFARVFLARQPELGDRWVAVKASPHGEIEAQILGKLIHPHVVPVYSVQHDAASGLSAVCMPYLGRTTLCDVLDQALRGPWPPRSGQAIVQAIDLARDELSARLPVGETWSFARQSYVNGVLRIGAALADALAHTHGQGVLHLDLKPSNVLIADDGRPMLLDFNLSLDERVVNGKVGGTLPYMSPEQIWSAVLGEASLPDTVDHRSDLFSLGVVLYELLTSRMPFGPVPVHLPSRDIAAHLLQQQRVGPLPLAKTMSGIDPALAQLIERCLAYDAGARPASAGELRDALRRQLSLGRRAHRWIAAHPRITRTVAMSAIVAAACIGYRVTLAPYPQRLLAASQQQWRDGDYEPALRGFNECLSLDPDWREARLGRALALQRQGEFLQAEAEYSRIDRASLAGRIAALRAYCLASAHRIDDAIRLGEQARSEGNESAELLANLGYCYNRRRDPQRARDVLDRCLSLHPGWPPALYQRAVAVLKQSVDSGNASPAQGLKDVAQLLKQFPDCADAHHLAVQLHAAALGRETGHVEPLLAHLEGAIRNGHSFHAPQEMTSLASLGDDPRLQRILALPVGNYRQNWYIRLVEPPLE